MDEHRTTPPSRKDMAPEGILYNHSFFDRELRTSRKLHIQTLVLPIVYTSLLMWACLSLYWGSTMSSNLDKLSGFAVILDGGPVGNQILQGINSTLHDRIHSLGWHIDGSLLSDASSKGSGTGRTSLGCSEGVSLPTTSSVSEPNIDVVQGIRMPPLTWMMLCARAADHTMPSPP